MTRRRRWVPGMVLLAAGFAACSGPDAGSGASDGRRGAQGADGGAGGEGGSIGEGLAIARLAYHPGKTGPHMLFRGTNPGDGALSLKIEFLDAMGTPVTVDLDGDGNPDSSELAIDATPDQLHAGGFFIDLHSAVGFDALVGGIAATPRNGNNEVGARKTAMLGAPPMHATGDDCDPQFDACAADAVCAPGLATGPSKCATAAGERANRCGAAAKIDSAQLPATTSGVAQGVSLWDPITGCAAPDAVGRPEGVVVLHVAEMAASLTITTARPETNFDTVIYVVPGCAGDTTMALACNDDNPAPTSQVVLHDVAPGDYLVIVDSVGANGGMFGLQVSAP